MYVWHPWRAVPYKSPNIVLIKSSNLRIVYLDILKPMMPGVKTCPLVLNAYFVVDCPKKWTLKWYFVISCGPTSSLYFVTTDRLWLSRWHVDCAKNICCRLTTHIMLLNEENWASGKAFFMLFKWMSLILFMICYCYFSWSWEPKYSRRIGEYSGCWCPGTLRHQDINC